MLARLIKPCIRNETEGALACYPPSKCGGMPGQEASKARSSRLPWARPRPQAPAHPVQTHGLSAVATFSGELCKRPERCIPPWGTNAREHWCHANTKKLSEIEHKLYFCAASAKIPNIAMMVSTFIPGAHCFPWKINMRFQQTTAATTKTTTTVATPTPNFDVDWGKFELDLSQYRRPLNKRLPTNEGIRCS